MDSEESYTIRFMEHVNRKKNSPFEVHAFTDGEKLKDYAKNHRIEILLISEHDMQEDTASVRAGQIIVLTDGIDSGGLYPNVCKYQASSVVMREVMQTYGMTAGEENAGAGTILKPPMKIAGVFSPVSRCLKTSFALTLGQCLAKNRAVLYLNFEASSGFRNLLRDHWERDISDVIYYIRRGERNITSRLLPLICEIGPMGFVPPSPSPAEVYGVRPEEWHVLFSSLRRDSSFETLILDLGELPLICPEILEECDVIYMPVKEDDMASAKVKEFGEELKARGTDLTDRIRFLHLGEISINLSGEKWAEHLPYGPLGKIAEERIATDFM
jgi:hypothetical protein